MTGFDAAARHYRPMMLRHATQMTGNHDDARDVVQDALVTLWRDWDNVVAFDNLLVSFRVATRRAFTIWKRQRSRLKRGGGVDHVAIDDSHGGSISGSQEASVTLAEVCAVIAQERHGADLTAIALGDSLSERAAEQGVSRQRIAARVAAARKRLTIIFGD